MDGYGSAAWTGAVARASGTRRHAGASVLWALAMICVPALGDGETAARKGRRKKKKTCPSGQTRCPKGFPSACCAAGTDCCDTSRLGCCEVG